MAAAVVAPIAAEVAKEVIPVAAEEIRKAVGKSSFAQAPPARPDIRIREISPEVEKALKALRDLEETLRALGMRSETFGAPELEPGRDPTLLDFLMDEVFSPLIILPGTSPKAPCRCFTIDTDRFCHRRGVIGTVSKERIPELCSEFFEVTDGRRERIRKFREATKTCKEVIATIPSGRERLIAWLECMGREARARGIEL